MNETVFLVKDEWNKRSQTVFINFYFWHIRSGTNGMKQYSVDIFRLLLMKQIE